MTYAHFTANIKSRYHKLSDKYLKPGGIIISEAFSKKHLEYVTANEKVGGSKDIESLFSIPEIKANFPYYEVLELEERK